MTTTVLNHSYSGRSVRLAVRVQVAYRTDISIDFLSEFKSRGIEIPFPQRELRLLQGNNHAAVRNSAES